MRIHVSKKNKSNKCESLYVDKWETVKHSNGSQGTLKDEHKGKVPIKTVQSHLYLGDIVTSDLSNTLNIKSRINKGQAVIQNIMEILEGT